MNGQDQQLDTPLNKEAAEKHAEKIAAIAAEGDADVDVYFDSTKMPVIFRSFTGISSEVAYFLRVISGAPDGEGVATLKSKGPVQEIGEGEGSDDEDDKPEVVEPAKPAVPQPKKRPRVRKEEKAEGAKAGPSAKAAPAAGFTLKKQHAVEEAEELQVKPLAEVPTATELKGLVQRGWFPANIPLWPISMVTIGCNTLTACLHC